MAYALLSQRRLLIIAGEDATDFLQGLVTNDVSKLEEGQVQYAALLSPQGKFLHDFFIIKWQGKYWIDSDGERIAQLRQRLMLYKLRSKVTIDVAPDSITVAAIWNQGLSNIPENIWAAEDPRLPILGQRAIGDSATLTAWLGEVSDEAAYDAWRIAAGVPDGAKDMIIDKSLLLEFDFEALHGVDFKKGCYVGQEVTARSKFRAQLKKQLFMVESGSPLPAIGTEIKAGDAVVGELRSSAGGQGLALLRTEELQKALDNKSALTAGEAVLTVQMPSWR